MNGLTILLISAAILLAAYFVYGRYLARKWGIDPAKKTPAREFEDGMDYVPTDPVVVFGHQFASIAGAGPINGPILAVMFGWAPVLLWILIGGIFFGAVQDFAALYASVKNKGKTIGFIIEAYIGRTGKRLFLIFVWLFSILVVAAFADIVAGTFGGFEALPVPSVPTNISATGTSTNSIGINWSSVSGATEYRVYLGTSAAGAYSLLGTTTSASYSHTGLSQGTTYYYKVSAYNVKGESEQSASVSASPNLARPGTPLGIEVTTSSNSVTVTWNAVPGATGYRVYRSSSASGTYNELGTTPSTSYDNTGLSSGMTYYYKVSAYNSVGEGAQSSYTSATTKPNAPTGVVATASSSSNITVSWNSVSGATGYRVYRSESSSGNYSLVATTASTSCMHTSLSAGTTYYYKVSAYNSAGTEGQQSSPVSATTLSTGGSGGGFATSPVNPATGQNYKTTVIGGKTWMADNLNYETSSGSWCYDNKPDSCKKYGRLYDWSAAMNISSSNNSNTWGGSDVNHQGVCPAGWHLPSRAEWNQLESDVGSPAGKALKSTSGWYNNGNGTDDYGFSALPGGLRLYSGGGFNGAGYSGYWWTATENYSGYAYYRYMYYGNDNLGEYYNRKEDGFAVRCVRDN